MSGIDQYDPIDKHAPPTATLSPSFPVPSFPGAPSRHSSGKQSVVQAFERPASPKPYIPPFLKTWFILAVAFAMIVLAVLVEVALYESQKHQGWKVRGIGGVGGTNFLKSALPVVLTTPIVYFWTNVDADIGRMQPWVVLAKGRAPAKRSLLLDYTRGRTSIMISAIRYRHWTVLISSAIVLTNMLLGYIAAGLLTSTSAIIITPNVQIQSIKKLGLDDGYVTLEYFNAAAGYTQAAAINNLTDPPFIWNGNWAVAEFKIPAAMGPGLNESILVPTTAIGSTAGCEPADTIDVNSNVPIGSNMTITGTWDGCTVTFNANHTGSDGYGVLPLGNCATHPEAPQFRPVLFWMYSAELNKADLTFCKPSIELWNVVAEANVVTGAIDYITLIDQNLPANNISGAPINGVPFNGIEFDTDGQDKYVQARALATQTGVAGAVYRGADQFGGASAVMQQANGFLNITEDVYNRFLALSAKQTYFYETNSIIETTAYSYEVRLAVYATAAHPFAAALIFIALLGAANHLVYRRERAGTPIAADPATIAAVLSTASSSRFAASLQGGMNDTDLENALAGRTFGISKRTWQIEATGDEEDLLQGLPSPPVDSEKKV